MCHTSTSHLAFSPSSVYEVVLNILCRYINILPFVKYILLVVSLAAFTATIMGFLAEGNTFQWEEIVISPAEFVKKHGIMQFLSIWEKVKGRKRDHLLWGEEVSRSIRHQGSL